MRARPLATLAAAAALVVAAAAAHADARIVLGVGGTGGSSDGPKRPGVAGSLSVLWTRGPLEFGPMLFADDLGSRIGRLTDPNDGTDLGTTATTHRYTYGGAWRVDVPVGSWMKWQGRVGTTWGYYRVQDDRVGIVERAISALGLSIGAGVSHRLFPSTGIGASVRYHNLLDTRQDHYVSATVDLSWAPPASGGPRTPRTATP